MDGLPVAPLPDLCYAVMCWANPSAAIQSDHQKELIAYNRGGQVLLFDLIIKES